MVIIAGTGAQSARETKELGVQAKESGAGWVLVLTPSTWAQAMGPITILEYHRDACPLPYMIYNNPTVTAGIDLDSDLISSLATHPNIVGTKLSSFDYQTSFATIGGKSDAHLHTLLSGDAGTIAALVNIVPKVHTKIYKIFLEYQKTSEAFRRSCCPPREIIDRRLGNDEDWCCGWREGDSGTGVWIREWGGKSAVERGESGCGCAERTRSKVVESCRRGFED
ncbi:hypothetical protein EV361DRAFT_167178 [Lentinula raphanica]|nr:hypothetical protein EV361DRAFT_167178 [Lentinula raphanica]